MFNRLLVVASVVFSLAQVVWAGTTKYFFVMIPPEMEEWMSSVPMLSMDGGLTGKPMSAEEGMCGWFSYAFADGEVTDNVVLYRSDDPIDPLTGAREDMIGVNGNWERTGTAQPIPLGMIFGMGVDSLFFVPDAEQKTNEDGFYYSSSDVGGVEGTCMYTLAAVIYDTDPSLHPAFSCWVELNDKGETNWDADCQTDASARKALQSCLGVTPGMVQTTLGPDKKPRLTETGKKCFLDTTLFNYMFNNTPGVNEMTCYDMPFKRSKDGRWEFDSDYSGKKSGEVQGGFFPREYTGMTFAQVDAMVIAAGSTPLASARLKHPAQGPAPLYSWLRAKDRTEDMPIFDLMCNGPGWDGGINCATHFADGNDLNGTTYHGTAIKDGNVWCLGDYCLSEIPVDWPTFVGGSETPGGTAPRWQSGDVTKSEASTAVGRNQHFCFESHASFTYKPGLRFNFRGDDDIWVFIGGKLAVDLGGVHMAAPAYVNLDSITDAQNQPFEVGKNYDLDIFFCDRRTPMSDVRISTNIYIQQKTAFKVMGRRNPTNAAETIYDLCYMKTGDGSCAAALSGSGKDEELCNQAILDAGLAMSYTLVRGKKYGENVVLGFDKISTPGVYRRGIDLTNFTQPKVDKSNTDLPSGYYTLFVTIEGKSKKVATFRMTGDVDVVYANGTIVDTTGAPTGAKINLKTTAMAGDLVPVYISNVAPADNGVEVYPNDAVGVEYTLSYDKLMNVFKKDYDAVTGAESYVKLTSGEKRVIGASGVDTVYATVAMDDMDASLKSFKISVAGRDNAMTINFFLPQISFIEKIPEANESAVATKGQKVNADGSYEEYWVGSVYDMYLAVLKPGDDGKFYKPCMEECNGIEIHKGVATSPKIDFIDPAYVFNNGYAKISVRSVTSYRWDIDPAINNPATIVAEYNDFIRAVYSPMYFRDSPVPFPVLSDVFDVHGFKPVQEYEIPTPYFDMDKEYLDGIGDSVAIYYDRPLHKDSLPSKICIMWDSVSAEEHNPYAEGFSTIPKDTLILCNALLDRNGMNADCSNLVDIDGTSGFCSNLITVGGLELSKKVKTSGVGKVHSYTNFSEKGENIKQGFVGPLVDRIAPVPLRANIFSLKNDGKLSAYDSLVVVMSEPVRMIADSNEKNVLDFYLNSATDLKESKRYASALGSGSTKVIPEKTAVISSDAKTGEGRVKFIYKRGGTSPHIGDYVRLGGDLSNVFWSDDADLSLPGADSLRAAADAAYYWNSPTGYKESKRLPSRWIPITSNNPEAIDNDPNFVFAEPTFRVVMTAPFQFTIVLDWTSNGATNKKYSDMDLQGRILQQGDISSAETVVPVLTQGSYIVKVGRGKRIVNVY